MHYIFGVIRVSGMRSVSRNECFQFMTVLFKNEFLSDEKKEKSKLLDLQYTVHVVTALIRPCREWG